MLRFDFYSEGHVNGNYVPEGHAEEAHYVGNFQEENPYSNMYNPEWNDHPNIKWSNIQIQNANQGSPQNPPPRKPSH